MTSSDTLTTPQPVQEPAGAVEVLRELVALKDLKERIRAFNPQHLWTREQLAEREALALDYERRQPLAWVAARSVLASLQPANTPANAPPTSVFGSQAKSEAVAEWVNMEQGFQTLVPLSRIPNGTPLYAAPQEAVERQPLTAAQLQPLLRASSYLTNSQAWDVAEALARSLRP